MNEQTAGLVPRLRFPEFREAGEWSSNFVKGLVSTVTPPKKLTSNLYQEEGRFPVIDQSQSYICGWTNDEDALVSADSPLIVFGDHTCVLKIVYQPFVQGADGIKIIKANEVIDPVFLYQYLLSDPVGMESYKRHFSTLREKRVVYPEKSTGEQQKIASCLSSLDALITARADKLEALKTHKKGLMQQLFPREGETIPRLRFPEFLEAGEWEVKKARFLFSNRLENGEDGLPIYSVTMYNGLAKRDSLDRKIDDISQSSGNKKVHKYDIAYNMMRMWQGASGVAVEDCMVSPAYVVLAPTDAVCAAFYGYLFKLPQALEVLTAHSQGLTKDRLRLYYKDFAQIPLPKPPVAEQQKIADCLSSLDALIAAQTEKLEALKSHKKGLMQQLFPSPDAVAA